MVSITNRFQRQGSWNSGISNLRYKVADSGAYLGSFWFQSLFWSSHKQWELKSSFLGQPSNMYALAWFNNSFPRNLARENNWTRFQSSIHKETHCNVVYDIKHWQLPKCPLRLETNFNKSTYWSSIYLVKGLKVRYILIYKLYLFWDERRKS